MIENTILQNTVMALYRLIDIVDAMNVELRTLRGGENTESAEN